MVSNGMVMEWKISYSRQLTLVPLLLDLNLLGQVLVLLPFDLVSNSFVVNKVTSIANFFLKNGQSNNMSVS